MGGFLRGFSQGINDGQKLGEIWNNSSMNREIKDANSIAQTQDSQYTPEQAAQLRDPAEAAGGVWDETTQHYKMPNGGLQAPAAAPTYSDGHYQKADGTVVAPANRFSLGSRTQGAAFTAEDIATEKLNRKADIYSNYGKEDLAEQMRGNALTRGLQQRQLKNLDDEAANEADYKASTDAAKKYVTGAKNLLSEVTTKVNAGTMPIEQGVALMLDHNNKNLDDGLSYSVDPVKGTLFLSQNGKTSTIQGHDGKPIVADVAHLPEISGLIDQKAKSYLKDEYFRTHPNAVLDGLKMEQTQSNSDRDFGANREDAATAATQDKAKYDQNEAHFKITSTLDENTRKDKNTQNKFENGIRQQELGLKGSLTRAQINNLNQRADGNELKVTPEQQNQLSMLTEAYGKSTDPRERATIAQNYEMVKNMVAVANKKYPTLGGLTKPVKELTPVDDVKIREMLQEDPTYKTAPDGVRARRLQDAYVRYGYAEAEPPKNVAPPSWQEAHPKGRSGQIRSAGSVKPGLTMPNQR